MVENAQWKVALSLKDTFALNKTLCRKEKNVPAHFNQSFAIKTIDRVQR